MAIYQRTALALAVMLLPLAAQEKRILPDQVQMTQYVMGFLKKGPNWSTGTKEEGARIQELHLANIRKMAEDGKLIIAGPFTDNGDIRGVFIFKVPMEEARAAAEQDPAIKAGRLVLELHPWYAAQGLKLDAVPK
jgi:uncharacterized protein YciI